MKKFLRVGVILLFLVGTLVSPNESCRVLIKGKEESVLVLQTLQKASEPPPGNCKGYTPGPCLVPDATNTRAFAGRAMAPPHVVNPAAFQSHGEEETLQKTPERPPGNPKSYTPGLGFDPDATNTRAFAGRTMAPPRMVNPVAFQSHGKEESILVLQTLQKSPERPPGNPEGYTPGGPRLAADATNARAFAG